MNYSQCPIHNPRVGNDPDVDVFLSNIGVEPELKLVTFLTICILVRLVLAGLATLYHEKTITPYIVAVVAIFAIWNLFPILDKGQWWSRKFHLVIAILVLLASGVQIYTGKRDITIASLLYIDVLFGILTFGYVYTTCPQ